MNTVYFVGAGPGDPELLTLKAARLIGRADVLVYAGSLVSPAVMALAKPGARLVDSAPLTLEQTHAIISEAHAAGLLVCRVHTGDPALYGTLAEQAALLDARGIPHEVVPGVTTASAAAAALKVSFTIPEQTQTLIITRAPGRTPMPEGESLRALAAHGCALAVYLSAHKAAHVQDELIAGGMPPDTVTAVIARLGWEGERRFTTRLDNLASLVTKQGIDRHAVILVLPGQDAQSVRSRLYDPEFAHGFRPET